MTHEATTRGRGRGEPRGVGRFRRRRPAIDPVNGIDGRLEIFEGMAPSEHAELGTLLTTVRVPAGRVLGREGQVSRYFIVVVEGQVAITLGGGPVAILDAGGFVGELPLLDRSSQTRHASWHALVDSTVAMANRQEFATMLSRFPLVADRVHAMAGRRRAYLEGRRDGAGSGATLDRTLEDYPVHLVDVS